mgnify:CR=1 FL=1
MIVVIDGQGRIQKSVGWEAGASNQVSVNKTVHNLENEADSRDTL